MPRFQLHGLTFGMICLLALTCSGCYFGTGITPANQDLGVVVRHRLSGEPVPRAIVGAMFPAREGLSDFVRTELDNGRMSGLGSASTDAVGYVMLPTPITGPRSGPGPEQITDGPIAFRVEYRNIVEYLHDPGLHVGDVIKGSHFELEIQSIGMPYARYPRRKR